MLEKKKSFMIYIIVFVLIICAGTIFYFGDQKKAGIEPNVYFSLLDINEKIMKNFLRILKRISRMFHKPES